MPLTNFGYDDDGALMNLPSTANDAGFGPPTQFATPGLQDPSARAHLQEYLHYLIGYLCMYAEDYRIAMRAAREYGTQLGEDVVVGNMFALMQDSPQAALRREFKSTILPDLLALLRSFGPLAPTVTRMDGIISAWMKEEWRTREPAVVTQAAWTSAQTLLTTDICRLVSLVPNVEHVFGEQVPALRHLRGLWKASEADMHGIGFTLWLDDLLSSSCTALPTDKEEVDGPGYA
ncbi:uncharacterized protein SCHCODRAFT_02641654 [Schizophyllum commune H4-8]|nr:uncharacterized protein SCHCODRAFT_02641654 [Schizophyllum commune H4-8]KAI5886405.1 hypothetical protein SCHCODRAFT_02641654 [Schizophyllum commune H4-8]